MRMSEPEAEPVSLGQAKIKRETAKALLVVLIDDDMKEQWVPKSCVDDNSGLFAGCVGQEELTVKAWWAEKEGFSNRDVTREQVEAAYDARHGG